MMMVCIHTWYNIFKAPSCVIIQIRRQVVSSEYARKDKNKKRDSLVPDGTPTEHPSSSSVLHCREINPGPRGFTVRSNRANETKRDTHMCCGCKVEPSPILFRTLGEQTCTNAVRRCRCQGRKRRRKNSSGLEPKQATLPI